MQRTVLVSKDGNKMLPYASDSGACLGEGILLTGDSRTLPSLIMTSHLPTQCSYATRVSDLFFIFRFLNLSYSFSFLSV